MSIHANTVPSKAAFLEPEPISRLSIPAVQTWPKRLQDIRKGLHKSSGFVPNFLTALSTNPGTALRLWDFYQSLFDPRSSALSEAERELIAVVTSVASGCSYCVFNHRVPLGQALQDPALADRIARNYKDVVLTPREQALADTADTLARQPHAVGQAQFERLREQGFDDAAILEILEVSAFFSYANRLTIALNVLPDAQFFTAHQQEAA